MSDPVFAAIADQWARRRQERLAREVAHDPALAAGRALGLAGPLTLERLVCDLALGALTASPPQLALIRAADGKPLEDALGPERMRFHFGCDELPGYDNGLLWDGQRLPSGRPRLVILRTGVRAGKTLISVLALLLSVLTCRFRRPLTDEELARGVKPAADGLVGVRRGELVRAVIVAPRLELTRAPFHHLISTMEASPALKALFAKEPLATSCVIRRPDGNEVEIKCLAADAGGANLRSTWLAGALFDEADFHDDDDKAVNLTENLRACGARMLAGAQIWIPSSPFGEGSAFDKLFQSVTKEQLKAGMLAFHSDSRSMNPTLNREEEEALRRRDPDAAAREYDAIPPGAGGAAFYTEDEIAGTFTDPYTPPDDARADVQRWEGYAPAPQFAHAAGVDMGFRKNSAALVISRCEEEIQRMVFRLELRPKKGEPLKPSEVVREFTFWCMRYGCTVMQGDNIGMDTAQEDLPKLARALENPELGDADQRAWVERVKADPWAKSARVPTYVHWSADIKHVAEAHTKMRGLMQEKRVVFPDDEHLKLQARGTKKKLLPSGQVVVQLPKHGMAHGDVWGAAVIAITDTSETEKWVPPVPLRRHPPTLRLAGRRGFG